MTYTLRQPLICYIYGALSQATCRQNKVWQRVSEIDSTSPMFLRMQSYFHREKCRNDTCHRFINCYDACNQNVDCKAFGQFGDQCYICDDGNRGQFVSFSQRKAMYIADNIEPNINDLTKESCNETVKRCYHVNATERAFTRDTGAEYCSKRHMTLVSLETLEEFELVRGIVLTYRTDARFVTNGTRTSNNNIRWPGNIETSEFSMWDVGQPVGDANCIALEHGKLHNYSCRDTFRVICEESHPLMLNNDMSLI